MCMVLFMGDSLRFVKDQYERSSCWINLLYRLSIYSQSRFVIAYITLVWIAEVIIVLLDASANFCHLLITLQTVYTKIGPYKMIRP